MALKEFCDFETAKRVVQQEGVRTSSDYARRGKSWRQKRKLPSDPLGFYQCHSWKEFLGRARSIAWTDFEEAKRIVREEGVQSESDYRRRGREWRARFGLPSSPRHVYAQYRGWDDFLGKMEQSERRTPAIPSIEARRRRWCDFEEAKRIVQQAGIKTSQDYARRGREWRQKRNLPGDPSAFYCSDWKGWREFLGTSRDILDFEMAKRVVQEQNVQSSSDYEHRGREWLQEMGLPWRPKSVYRGQFSGWDDFLGRSEPLPPRRSIPSKKKDSLFVDFSTAKTIVREERVRSAADYAKRGSEWRSRLSLPSNPGQSYCTEFNGWADFLGKAEQLKYAPFAKARKLLKAAGLRTQAQYEDRSDDWFRAHQLPRNPKSHYSRHWRGWKHFLGREALPRERDFVTYERAKELVSERNIQTYTQYRNSSAWLRDNRIPICPERTYSSQWEDWDEYLAPKGKIEDPFVDYDSARRLVINEGITTAIEYFHAATFRSAHSLPARPDLYFSEWIGWPSFLGKVHDKTDSAKQASQRRPLNRIAINS